LKPEAAVPELDNENTIEKVMRQAAVPELDNENTIEKVMRPRKTLKFDRERGNFKMYIGDDSEDTEDFSEDYIVKKEMKFCTKVKKYLDRTFDDLVFGTFLLVIKESFMQMMVAGVLYFYIPVGLDGQLK
jgi:hypothetical protein